MARFWPCRRSWRRFRVVANLFRQSIFLLKKKMTRFLSLPHTKFQQRKSFFIIMIWLTWKNSHSSLCRWPSSHFSLQTGNPHLEHLYEVSAASSLRKHCKQPMELLEYGPTTAGSSVKINSNGSMSLEATINLKRHILTCADPNWGEANKKGRETVTRRENI